MINLVEIKNKKIVHLNTCRICGKKLKDEWNFCPNCKNPVETYRCHQCGNTIRYDWNYCPHCKNEVQVELTNKLRIDQSNDWLRNILK